MIFLAHRANTNGRNIGAENSLGACRSALEMGFGLEMDIRRAPVGSFYFSHDRQLEENIEEAGAHFQLFQDFPSGEIALNVKETGYENALVDIIRSQGLVKRSFLFDMEIIESQPGQMAKRLKFLCPDLRLAVRVSDRNEPVNRAMDSREAGLVWADEFDRYWLQEKDIIRMKKAGKMVYVVSPELHGATLEEARKRWADFFEWGVDGICTDYPEVARRQFRDGGS